MCHLDGLSEVRQSHAASTECVDSFLPGAFAEPLDPGSKTEMAQVEPPQAPSRSEPASEPPERALALLCLQVDTLDALERRADSHPDPVVARMARLQVVKRNPATRLDEARRASLGQAGFLEFKLAQLGSLGPQEARELLSQAVPQPGSLRALTSTLMDESRPAAAEAARCLEDWWRQGVVSVVRNGQSVAPGSLSLTLALREHRLWVDGQSLQLRTPVEPHPEQAELQKELSAGKADALADRLEREGPEAVRAFVDRPLEQKQNTTVVMELCSVSSLLTAASGRPALKGMLAQCWDILSTPARRQLATRGSAYTGEGKLWDYLTALGGLFPERVDRSFLQEEILPLWNHNGSANDFRGLGTAYLRNLFQARPDLREDCLDWALARPGAELGSAREGMVRLALENPEWVPSNAQLQGVLALIPPVEAPDGFLADQRSQAEVTMRVAVDVLHRIYESDPEGYARLRAPSPDGRLLPVPEALLQATLRAPLTLASVLWRGRGELEEQLLSHPPAVETLCQLALRPRGEEVDYETQRNSLGAVLTLERGRAHQDVVDAYLSQRLDQRDGSVLKFRAEELRKERLGAELAQVQQHPPSLERAREAWQGWTLLIQGGQYKPREVEQISLGQLRPLAAWLAGSPAELSRAGTQEQEWLRQRRAELERTGLRGGDLARLRFILTLAEHHEPLGASLQDFVNAAWRNSPHRETQSQLSEILQGAREIDFRRELRDLAREGPLRSRFEGYTRLTRVADRELRNPDLEQETATVFLAGTPPDDRAWLERLESRLGGVEPRDQALRTVYNRLSGELEPDQWSTFARLLDELPAWDNLIERAALGLQMVEELVRDGQPRPTAITNAVGRLLGVPATREPSTSAVQVDAEKVRVGGVQVRRRDHQR